MKIIDIGICIDNDDPKGLGRIRCVDYDDYVSGKENYKSYEKWGEDDPFIAVPFLPNNINFIPEVQQSVKVLRYNTQKTTVNQEYIAGPFTTRFDFNKQIFSEQISLTTFGSGIKDKSNIFSNGKLPADCENTLSKNNDYSISGKYGSDILLTEGGLVLTGGKLLSKQAATSKELQRLVDFPIYGKKNAKLQLKKFSEKKVLVEEERITTRYDNVNLKYVIEYTIDSLTTPTIVNFFIYKINTGVFGDIFKSNSFTEFTQLPLNLCVLLNDDGTTTKPTFSVDMTTKQDFNDSNINQKIKQITSEIRLTLTKIKEDGFVGFFNSDINKKFDSTQELSDVYPFFFRPTSQLRTLSTSDSQELDIKNAILTGIRLAKNVQQSGLVWSNTSFSAPPIYRLEKIKNLKKDDTSKEQTFSSVTSDKIYLVSTDTNFTDKTIEFEKLNNYEYEQDDYLNKIDPNTYGVVRGEILLEFLKSMYNVLLSHTHNINKPYARTSFDDHETMSKLYDSLESQLLNKSIRIN
jgi:hypothetical protein